VSGAASGLLCERYLEELKGAPILFSGNVIGRANKAKHICNLAGFVKLNFIFSPHCGQLIAKDFREILISRLVPFLFGIKETAYFCQLADVQPKASAKASYYKVN